MTVLIITLTVIAVIAIISFGYIFMYITYKTRKQTLENKKDLQIALLDCYRKSLDKRDRS